MVELRTKTGKPIGFTQHAKERMIRRGISEQEVKEAIDSWEVIEEYPDIDGYLLWGKDQLYVHVVCLDQFSHYLVVSVYRPSEDSFTKESEFKERKREK
ncbi:MAG: DUF4258 domain-containing protein [Promethearchaeota archaeon]